MTQGYCARLCPSNNIAIFAYNVVLADLAFNLKFPIVLLLFGRPLAELSALTLLKLLLLTDTTALKLLGQGPKLHMIMLRQN